MSDEVWTEADINNMSMAEYAKHREHIREEIRHMTPEEARECMEIRKPPPPFHFEGF